MHRYWSRLWAAVERFARARSALAATFVWNLAQGAIVPGPTELMLAPLVLAEPARAKGLALVATIGSVLGGCLAWTLGAVSFASMGRPTLEALGVSEATLEYAMALMARYGWLFIVASTLTPLSTKAVSIAAGAAGMPLPIFAAALTLGRGVRFGAVALLLRAGSGALHRLLGQRSRA